MRSSIYLTPSHSFLAKDQNHPDPISHFDRSNIAYDIIFILRQQAIEGGEVGKHIVGRATTNEILEVIPGVLKKLRGELGDKRAEKTRCRVEETWPFLARELPA